MWLAETLFFYLVVVVIYAAIETAYQMRKEQRRIPVRADDED